RLRGDLLPLQLQPLLADMLLVRLELRLRGNEAAGIGRVAAGRLAYAADERLAGGAAGAGGRARSGGRRARRVSRGADRIAARSTQRAREEARAAGRAAVAARLALHVLEGPSRAPRARRRTRGSARRPDGALAADGRSRR